MHLFDLRVLVISLLLIMGLPFSPAQADSGWYLGGSVGQAYVDFDVSGTDNEFGIDASDQAWKLFGGYVFDLPLVDLGVEGGYVDFGSPSERSPSLIAEADASGFNLWGVAGLDVGPVGVFGKVGAIAWELDGQANIFVSRTFFFNPKLR